MRSIRATANRSADSSVMAPSKRFVLSRVVRASPLLFPVAYRLPAAGHATHRTPSLSCRVTYVTCFPLPTGRTPSLSCRVTYVRHDVMTARRGIRWTRARPRTSTARPASGTVTRASPVMSCRAGDEKGPRVSLKWHAGTGGGSHEEERAKHLLRWKSLRAQTIAGSNTAVGKGGAVIQTDKPGTKPRA